MIIRQNGGSGGFTGPLSSTSKMQLRNYSWGLHVHDRRKRWWNLHRCRSSPKADNTKQDPDKWGGGQGDQPSHPHLSAPLLWAWMSCDWSTCPHRVLHSSLKAVGSLKTGTWLRIHTLTTLPLIMMRDGRNTRREKSQQHKLHTTGLLPSSLAASSTLNSKKRNISLSMCLMKLNKSVRLWCFSLISYYINNHMLYATQLCLIHEGILFFMESWWQLNHLLFKRHFAHFPFCFVFFWFQVFTNLSISFTYLKKKAIYLPELEGVQHLRNATSSNN